MRDEGDIKATSVADVRKAAERRRIDPRQDRRDELIRALNEALEKALGELDEMDRAA